MLSHPAGNRLVRAGEDTVKQGDAKLFEVVIELSSGLSKEVYSADVRALVENARCVLDLASLALKLKELGSNHIKVAAVEFPKFKEAIQKVPIVSIQSNE